MTASDSPIDSRQITDQVRDAGMFLQEAFRTFRETGSITPSAAPLCNALTRYVRERDPADAPLEILEAGAGTGPVSVAIAASMQEKDSLALVESNGRFVSRLEEVVATDPAFATVADRTSIHHCLVTELPPERNFDLIVSGLPFANFEKSEVRAILEYYFDVLRPGGHVSFYGYLGTKQFRAVFGRRDEYLRQAQSTWVVEEYIARYGVDRERIAANVPPAWVHHLRKP
ncbi:methyltransferase domain-containing protein [Lipingzhangella sp. LS1_29]|uniref:Methyltransferase domain-containing protein n=1 Tax=Lipingzhangella rawalii TaxID=2055835 RepID=A0ABU2H4X9_9ACTN|nr:methyltransferase domain-containing protein [Lipingzhangella rawalii]MDS1270047.1 methyltransferase domain-containing protein [Lipingzhangella rawalii]